MPEMVAGIAGVAALRQGLRDTVVRLLPVPIVLDLDDVGVRDVIGNLVVDVQSQEGPNAVA